MYINLYVLVFSQVIEDVCNMEWAADSNTVLFTRYDGHLRPSRVLLRDLQSAWV